MDKFQTTLPNYGIVTCIDEMTMTVGTRMWESKMFTEDQMVSWENKPKVDQTQANMEDYFTQKWLECCKYLAATAKHLQFKEAILAAQEQAIAEKEGETMAMMFALLQEQHKMQLEVLATLNRITMDAMFECINALVTGRGKHTDKENNPPTGTNTGSGTRTKRVGKM